MIELTGVRARPGSRVDLKFTPVGVSITREKTVTKLDRWFGARPMLGAAGTLLLQAWPLAVLIWIGAPAGTVLLAAVPALLALLYLLAGGLYHSDELIGMILFWVLLWAVLVTLPVLLVLLLSSRFRRWAFGRRGQEDEAPERPPGLVPTDHLVEGRMWQKGGLTSVTVDFADGSTVCYTAPGIDGVRMLRGFDALLGERLVPVEPPST